MKRYNSRIHHRKSIRLKGYDYSQAGLYFITICCQDRICRFGQVENGEMILNEYGQIASDEWVKLSERFPNFKLDVFQIMPNHLHGIIVLNDIPVGATLAVAPNNVVTPNDAVAPDDAVAPNDTVAPNDLVVPNDVIIGDDIRAGANDAIVGDDIRSGADDVIVGDDIRAGASPAPTKTVGDIVGAYKSLVANGCLDIYKSKNEIMGKLWQRNYHEHIIRNEQSYQRITEYIINNPAKWTGDKFYNQ